MTAMNARTQKGCARAPIMATDLREREVLIYYVNSLCLIYIPLVYKCPYEAYRRKYKTSALIPNALVFNYSPQGGGDFQRSINLLTNQ